MQWGKSNMLNIFKMKKLCSISLLVMSFSSLSYASIDSSHSVDQQLAIQGDIEAQFQMGQQYHMQDVQHPDPELQNSQELIKLSKMIYNLLDQEESSKLKDKLDELVFKAFAVN